MSEKIKDLEEGFFKETKTKRVLRMFFDGFKNVGKKALLGITLFGMFVGLTFTFTGCKSFDFGPTQTIQTTITTTQQSTPSVIEPGSSTVIQQPSGTTTSSSSSSTPAEPKPVENATIQEFTTKYQEKALSFAQTKFKASLTNGKELLSEKWSFSANNQNQITSITLDYTFAGQENIRTREISTITFTEPISIDDIIHDRVKPAGILGVVQTREVFSFDAKQNYCQAELGQALFSACELTDGTKYFREVNSTNPETKKYEVSYTINGNTAIYTVEVESADSIEGIIENLKDETKTSTSIKKTYTSIDSKIEVKQYSQEVFQPESVQDLVDNYSTQLHSALNKHFFPEITYLFYGRSFDETKLIDPEWRIISDGNQITGFKFITKYSLSSLSEQYRVGTINLSRPINLSDITNEKADTLLTNLADTATYSADYSYAYTIAHQGTRDALVSKIFEVNGMGAETPEGAERYFVEVGAILDDNLGEARQFKLVQKEDDVVTEFILIIREQSSDDKYLSMLDNEKNYYFTSEKIIETQGIKIDYKKTTSLEDEIELE